MTVAIPERSTRAPARQRRPTGAEMGRAPAPRPAPIPAGTRGRGPSGGTGSPGRPARRGTPQGKGKSKRRAAAGRLTGARTKPGGRLHNYQAIIAAEFVAAIILVALTPIASRKASASAASGKLSPYVPGDLIQLVAIGIVYLILEGVAAGPKGAARFAAWFGFLLLLGVGLFEASRLGKLFQMLAGGGVSTTVLTGAAAPATKGESPIPPLGQGQTASTTPAPPPGG